MFLCYYHRGTTYIMFSESESEDDLIEQAYDYKVNGKYPEGCTLNNKRSIRRKADKIVLQNGDVCMKKKTKGTNELEVFMKL